METAAEVIAEIRTGAPLDCDITTVIVDETLGEEPIPRSLGSSDRIVFLPFRYGNHTALVHTLRHRIEMSNFDWICLLDGDGEDRPEDLWTLMSAATHGKEVVLAGRRSRNSSLIFNIGYFLFQVIHRVLTGEGFRTGTFSVVSTQWLAKNIARPEFSISLAGALASLPAKRELIFCDRGKRRRGYAKLKARNAIEHALRTLIIRSNNIAVRSFVALACSTLLATIGIVYVSVLVTYDLNSPGWITSALTLAVLTVGLFLTVFLVSCVLFCLILLHSLPRGSER